MRTVTAFISLLFPALVFGSHVGANLLRRHEKRAEDLQKRGGDKRFSYYDITTGEVACGGYYQPNDYVVALTAAQWDGGSHCHETITISYQGQTVSAQIVDECAEGCPYGGLDFTEGLMRHFVSDPANVGIIYGDWSFGSGAPQPETTTSKAQPKPTSTTPKPTPTTTSKPPPETSTTPLTTSSAKPSTTSTSSAAPSSSPPASSSAAAGATPTVNAIGLGLASVQVSADLSGTQNLLMVNDAFTSLGAIVLIA